MNRRKMVPVCGIALLIAYLHTADGAMRVERVAALKNDVTYGERPREAER